MHVYIYLKRSYICLDTGRSGVNGLETLEGLVFVRTVRVLVGCTWSNFGYDITYLLIETWYQKVSYSSAVWNWVLEQE